MLGRARRSLKFTKIHKKFTKKSQFLLRISQFLLRIFQNKIIFQNMIYLADTGRIYIKGYLYPILYPKISKKDISYPFLEQDILRI
jgi:hypothetical protein